MGLLSAIGINSAPKPVTNTSATTQASAPVASSATAPKGASTADTFETAAATQAPVDLGAGDAVFPAEWAAAGSGGGGKVGSVEG